MAKKTYFDNYIVKVYVQIPFGSRSTDHKMWIDAAKRLEEEIKRHCDHDGTEIDFEDVSECEHCGARWTEKSDQYNGGCCEKDLQHCAHIDAEIEPYTCPDCGKEVGVENL